MPLSIRLKQAFIGTFKSLYSMMPMLLAVIGLVGLFQVVVTPEMLHSVFNGMPVHDGFIGTLIGGISIGQPFFSYIIGGELLDQGISLYAVCAFILAWVTLGVLQLPLEWSMFGGRFTITRNLLSFVFALVIAWATVITLGILL
jgi:uncharacterized membrane protein YraQ (UPF0718 family)